VPDPKARDAVGVGGFNLVRRSAYHAVGGFDALRMEVVDDMRLGRRLKRAGFAQRMIFGPDLVRVRWLSGVFGIVRAAEKNAYAAFNFNTSLFLLTALGLALEIVVPLVALAAGGWNTLAGVLFYASVALLYHASSKVTKAHAWMALSFAPVSAIILFAMLRSMVLTLARGGVAWRGTLYPLADLRRHARAASRESTSPAVSRAPSNS
jgi:hypothetical protein